MDNKSHVYSINGSVVTVRDTTQFSMQEMVYVGGKRLVGEVISISEHRTTIQVYELTTGLSPGDPVIGTGAPLSATLAPGILSTIFDGIERPLRKVEELSGSFISEGTDLPSVPNDKRWNVTMRVQKGDDIAAGDIFATCPETALIEHRFMIPKDFRSGTVTFAASHGEYTVDDVILRAVTDDGIEREFTMLTRWPIRVPRPLGHRLPISKPLITGQRIIDSMFPLAKGGTAAIPGGFGTGKTMTQHQFAKWCDADIIVYIGCGERGNEMTQVLEEFTDLIDPKSGRPLTDRTVLIANTSNMPVAAREASIYTGITIAEYYRDMGYHVAIMADSTSRWAEALREISGRLEEMPAEEGFPAYLPSRLSQFYERAGFVRTVGNREGSVTIVGAVSPQGADFSEPVTQNTKRFVRCFLALDKSLAYARHYPAINWTLSYSEYLDDLSHWYAENVNESFLDSRQRVLSLLHEESRLMDIVKLIGADVLPEEQKLILEIARVIRLGFLQQNAFHKVDTFVPLPKQHLMMDTILRLYSRCKELIGKGALVSSLLSSGIFDKIIRMKYDVENDQLEKLDGYIEEINDLTIN